MDPFRAARVLVKRQAKNYLDASFGRGIFSLPRIAAMGIEWQGMTSFSLGHRANKGHRYREANALRWLRASSGLFGN